jgi:hypothetical protein
MRDFETLTDHPVIEAMVDIITKKVQNQNKNFFRIESAYFLAKLASTMRAQIVTKDRGVIPVNLYALCLAPSGFGKGHSISIIEDYFMSGFKNRFIENTLNTLAERNMLKLATQRSVFRGTNQAEELLALEKEYAVAGPYPYTFDSGTVPAVKQLRQKLLLADAGAINLQIDEIGSNLLQNTEILSTFLELYDKGKTKAKLTKNTVDNSRGVDIDGPTPANMLLFGTPTKLLDGGSTEEMFFEFLQTGYSRRFLFAWGTQDRSSNRQTAEDIYADLVDPASANMILTLSKGFTNLADPLKHMWEMRMPDDVAIELLKYKIMCETEADKLPEHFEMQKTELNHRYFKALKLSGVFGFIDQAPEISMDNLYHAIHLVESSGADFAKLLSREKAYVKLAKYIASHDQELTHADLTEALPYYKTSNSQRNEIMTLATAWGYKNNIMIKKSFVDGIEFFSGEALTETDLSRILFSYSDDYATGYQKEIQPFDELYRLAQADGLHWCNHTFINNHRRGDNVIEGFNMVVLDVDGKASRDMVHEMLRDYTFMTYTTKRHRENGTGPDRFRVLMPIKYQLFLNKEDYQQFMNNIIEWLPFEIDEEANQRERKWLTNSNTEVHYNIQGTLLDPIRFIPKTAKNESHRAQMNQLKDLDSLERWFAERMVMGNRNNQMIKYALALLDGGVSYVEIERRVIEFNGKIDNGLSDHELQNTILRSVAKRAATLGVN